ncbi:hypothetical protein Desdi_0843 [Desulfitobacterium dichloroeliminans LMG P-21439]|uniref:Uncharacterized protein n=1 Tax=Desulfitobacterium dichloroeliminans (strain LMG P-21439 / DCA1) TaxID=871963 RepID=L0F5A0_DESDL|nr:hypothetical protein [Desulfitobacterium dichloroeliminans]AGA68367.1 hypothetical protein Desdi_0843 [Desulfitobacterium dichloroeliminans LMG P-21439]
MRKEKNSLSVVEAKQQFKESMAKFKPKQILADNIMKCTLVSFVTGMVAADSVKSRESLVSLAVTVVKKAL